MLTRSVKQLIIGLISLFVIGWIFVASLFYIWINLKPKDVPPVNGTDPTVKFKDLEVLFTNFFEIGNTGTYTALSLIKNPNTDYGASKISYEFIFKDENNKEIRTIKDASYILPDYSRYIIKSGVMLTGDPEVVIFRISEAQWESLPPLTLAGLTFKDTGLARDETAKMMKFSGVVENRSPYNLQNLDVEVVLYGPETNKAVAAGRTDMQTLFRGQDRFFQITWPFVLEYEPRADFRVETNLFENSNFIKDQEKRERFQDFFNTEAESDKK